MSCLLTIADSPMPTVEMADAWTETVVVPFLESASRGLLAMLGLIEAKELDVADQSPEMADLLNAREAILHFNELFIEPIKIQV